MSYRSADNVLRLTLDHDDRPVADERELDGLIDIADQGRLVGVELPFDGFEPQELFGPWIDDSVAASYVTIDVDGAYIALSAPRENMSDMHVRTAQVKIRTELDRQQRLVALGIPRRGHGYEISYPSGNR